MDHTRLIFWGSSFSFTRLIFEIMRAPCWILYSFLLLWMFTSSCTAPGAIITAEKVGGTLVVFDDGDPRFVYQFETKSVDEGYARANYLHPLYGLHGEVLTEDFPADHLHQRGIFWTWHQVNVDGKRVADPWLCKGMAWVLESLQTDIQRDRAEVHALLGWVLIDSLGEYGERIVEEAVKLTYLRGDTRQYHVEVEVALRALVDRVEIGGSEDDKGYGGFSARLVLPADIEIKGERPVEPQTTPVDAGGWVEFRGSYSSTPGAQAAVVLMCEPAQLPAFQGWILRKSASMQNPAFPGRVPIFLSKVKPLEFRHRLLVHDGTMSSEAVAAAYRSFLEEPSSFRNSP